MHANGTKKNQITMKHLEQEKPNKAFHFYIISILIAFWIGLAAGAGIAYLM
jgi:hypothetical protein